MLKITIEIIPFGIEKMKKTLGTMKIWNDGTGTSSSGNYGYKIFKKDSETLIWKEGKINAFPRKSKGIWDLLFRTLYHAVGYRNPKIKTEIKDE